MANFNLNKVILGGRVVADPELKQTPSGVSVLRLRVAVNRRFSNRNAEQTEPQADFFDVVAWRQTAEFAAKYFRKGSAIAVIGSIRTGSYDAQDGTKRYTTDIYADTVEFVPKSYEDSSSTGSTSYNTSYGGGQSGPSISVAEPKKAQKSKKIDDLEVINDDDNDLPF